MRIGRVGSQWLLAGVLALGVSYWSPRPQIAVAQRHGDFEKDVQIGDLTREARHTIEGEARDHKIVAIQQVRHGDHEFYRVDIEQPGADKIIRVGLDGRVFSVEEVVDTGWVPPHRYMVEEEIRAGVERPDTVVMERIPPRAKFALLRLAEGGRIEALVAYRDHEHVVFQANVQDPEDSHRTLVIQVGVDGHVIGETVIGRTEDRNRAPTKCAGARSPRRCATPSSMNRKTSISIPSRSKAIMAGRSSLSNSPIVTAPGWSPSTIRDT